MFHTILRGIVLIGALGTAFTAHPQSLEQRVDRYIASIHEPSSFQGVVLVSAGEKILLEKGYGLANREFAVPHGPRTKFQVGSITKPFTAVLTLKLAEQGLLKLDGTISDYLPEFPPKVGKRITLRHLLSHTSGIPHHFTAVPDYFLSHDKVFHTTRDLWNLFAKVPLVHEPGAKFTYSSPGYYILGAILQSVSHRSYAELLQEHIFDPLGMKDSSVENNRTVRDQLATGYIRGLSGLIRGGFEDKSTSLAAGDLITTARDLYLWDRGMKATPSRVLSAESKALLLQTTADDTFSFGGPVLSIPPDGGGKPVLINRLSGSSAGYDAAMDRLLEPDACIIVLSNIQDAETSKISDVLGDFLLRNVLGLAVGTPSAATVTAPPVDSVKPSEMAPALGFYRDPKGTFTGITLDGGRAFRMIFSPRGSLRGVSVLFSQGPGVFRLNDPNGPTLTLGTDPKDGRPTLTTSHRGRTLGVATRHQPSAFPVAEYAGAFTSVELQKTFRFLSGPAGLTAEGFLGAGNEVLVFLEKDLFGCQRGYLRFTRSPEGMVTGFTLMTKDTDPFMGSRFNRI